MDENDGRALPGPEEIAAADALAREFLEQISAVPPERRRLFTSDKFSGAFAEPIESDSTQQNE